MIHEAIWLLNCILLTVSGLGRNWRKVYCVLAAVRGDIGTYAIANERMSTASRVGSGPTEPEPTVLFAFDVVTAFVFRNFLIELASSIALFLPNRRLFQQ